MFQVIFLSFREYFEAFLLITGFSLLCYKYGFNRTKEIAFGSVIAFLISLTLTIYVLATGASFFKEAQTDYIEGWLLLSSSVLIAIFAFPLHSMVWKKVEGNMPKVEKRLTAINKDFDWVLALIIGLLVFKEGMEGLLFTAGVSLSQSTNSIENIVGLVFGFLFAAGLALVIRMTSLYLHIDRIFSVIALFILLGIGTLFHQGLMQVFGLPYGIADLLAGVYCCFLYVAFINRKVISD